VKNFNALLRFVIYHAAALAIAVLMLLYIVYTLQFMIPGNIMRAMLGEQTAAAAESGELPLPPTFVEWVTGDSEQAGILNWDWGDSFRMNRPVTELLSERLPTTVELVQYTLMIALPVGIVLGILMALLRRYLSDSPLSIAAHLAVAIPVFVMGLLLLYQLGIQQRLFPMGGRCSPGMAEAECSARLWEYLTLPVASLAIFWSGALALYVRDAIWRRGNSGWAAESGCAD
jgi:peptide/nickel transport system permease protein